MDTDISLLTALLGSTLLGFMLLVRSFTGHNVHLLLTHCMQVLFHVTADCTGYQVITQLLRGVLSWSSFLCTKMHMSSTVTLHRTKYRAYSMSSTLFASPLIGRCTWTERNTFSTCTVQQHNMNDCQSLSTTCTWQENKQNKARLITSLLCLTPVS